MEKKGMTGPVAAVMAVVVIMYANRVAPALPPTVDMLLNTLVARIVFIYVIASAHMKDQGQAAGLAVVLALGLNFLTGKGLLESFRIDQNTNIHPDCMGITLADIRDKAFSGDEGAMMQAMRNAVTPYNVPINDEFAPLIATYLINGGYDLGPVCNLTSKVKFW